MKDRVNKKHTTKFTTTSNNQRRLLSHLFISKIIIYFS